MPARFHLAANAFPRGSCFIQCSERRRCAKSEVNSIDTQPKPKVTVKESIVNAKVYCKQNPAGTVSLRDYSGGIYNQACTTFAADQHVTDPSYKIGSDWPAQARPRKPGGKCPRGGCEKAVSTGSSLGAGCGVPPTGWKPPLSAQFLLENEANLESLNTLHRPGRITKPMGDKGQHTY